MTVVLAALAGATERAHGAPSERVAARTAVLRRPATGRIEGTVEISTVLSARRTPIRIYADPGSGSLPPAAPRDPIAAELKNVVVYLVGDAEHLTAPASRVDAHRRGSIAQHDERFAPHVVAVMQGGTVDFPNEDDVFHNVYSLSTASTFDLGRYPKGDSRAATFNKTGRVPVFCHIHADMSAIVLVLSNPYFASPGDDHKFVIDEVPEGDYTIVGWHERIRTPITWRIHVTVGQATVVDFNIPLPQGGTVPR